MSRPIIKFVNLETNQEIEREMNDAEFAQYEIDQADAASRAAAKAQAEAEAQAKRSAALAKLEALGLYEDDLKALGL